MGEEMILREEVQALIGALFGCLDQSPVNNIERVIGLARVVSNVAELAHRDVGLEHVGVHRTLDELAQAAFVFIQAARAAGVGAVSIHNNQFNTSEVFNGDGK